VAGRRQRVERADGLVEEIFSKNYWPGDDPLSQVEFALKYEPVSLDLLHHVFFQIDRKTVDRYIKAAPTGKYRRRIGFLYEYLTARDLDVAISGNYVAALDARRYYVGKPRANPRWRVTDNLLGSAGFCPIVRKTSGIESKLKTDWSGEIRKLVQAANPTLLTRAVNYLYHKETKASFEIERESVGSKEERFVEVLAKVGKENTENLLDETRLVELQNLIVDPRYAERGFRTVQNYISETLPNLRERVHYVCPPPLLVKTLVAGLRTFLLRSEGLPAPIRAAVTSFGFVFVHPFKDGNGRLHRLLLHESLAHDRFTDVGLVLPFSAVMLRDRISYDRVLELFSKTVLDRVRYTLSDDGTLKIENPAEAAAVWRYPDLTPHVQYVLELIETTVTRDLPSELDVLRRHDLARENIKRIVDLPGRKLNLLLRLLHQNRGALSKSKRNAEFSELTDPEVTRIEEVFREAFEL
jgi:AcrR family transcriptional regulator